jgi:hypothetical protein
MSFSSFPELESLSKKTEQFGLQTAANISRLRGRNVSTQDAEQLHTTISGLFQSAMNEVSKLKWEIARKDPFSNEKEMFKLEIVTGFETELLEQLKTFNDTVLTYCPTAKIVYGDSCVGPRTAPKISTSDVKVLKMLENSSCIREIRGDGNCFLSAFTTRFLENLVEKKEIENLIHFMTEDGINDQELKQELILTLLNLQENPSQLENILKNNHKILPFINYFRQLTANEMKKYKQDFVDVFLNEMEEVYGAPKGQSYENLIDQYVLRMGVDFNHPMIIALCRRLNFPVRIIDPKIGATEGMNVLDSNYAHATFCRKESHYFVLYPSEKVAPIPVVPVQPKIETPPLKPTEIVIKCKIPFGHNLFIRGGGNGLSWEKGTPLIKLDDETWIYRSNAPLQNMEYKFLIDDSIWHDGDNHKIVGGKLDGASPHFTLPASISADILETPVRTTRITVKFDTGLGNKLFIRGNGPGLNWEKGVELRNVGNDVWVYETQANFENLEYKILLNDQKWEDSHDHKTDCGKQEEIVPKFN